MSQSVIESTDDISSDLLKEFAIIAELKDVEPSEHHYFMRSSEPPSWISIIADSSWWIKAFSAVAALYVAEIVKEAAKESWKNRADIFKHVQKTASSIHKIATAFLAIKSKCKSNSYLVVGLPIPDNTYTTNLYLKSDDADQIASEIALFVHHLPAIVDYLTGTSINSKHALGWISISINEDCSVEIKFMHKQSLDTIIHIIPLVPHA